VVRRHRRFELLDVTLADAPIGSCTIDLWEDDGGAEQWSARVLMKLGHGSTEGTLIGRTRDGRFLTGMARFAADQQGPRGGRTVLVELHGQGPLAETTEPPAPTTEPATEPAPTEAADGAGTAGTPTAEPAPVEPEATRPTR
jgi:hypothetical protein